LKEAADLPDAYTFMVKDGIVNIERNWDNKKIRGEDRMQCQLELLDPIAKFLPDMNITHSLHDTPRCFVGFEHRALLDECLVDPECELFITKQNTDILTLAAY